MSNKMTACNPNQHTQLEKDIKNELIKEAFAFAEGQIKSIFSKQPKLDDDLVRNAVLKAVEKTIKEYDPSKVRINSMIPLLRIKINWELINAINAIKKTQKRGKDITVLNQHQLNSSKDGKKIPWEENLPPTKESKSNLVMQLLLIASLHLDEIDLELVKLRFMEDLSSKEISKIVKLSEATIYRRSSRALLHIRGIFKWMYSLNCSLDRIFHI